MTDKQKKDEILKWHWAGKNWGWISCKYEVTKAEIEKIVLEDAEKKRAISGFGGCFEFRKI